MQCPVHNPKCIDAAEAVALFRDGEFKTVNTALQTAQETILSFDTRYSAFIQTERRISQLRLQISESASANEALQQLPEIKKSI